MGIVNEKELWLGVTFRITLWPLASQRCRF